MLPRLLSQIQGRIGQVSGDGAYDTRACYQSILDREAVATIPPRRNARLSEGVEPPDWRAMRDASLRRIGKLGRYEWRASSGCTRQSLAENAVSRFKTMFGSKLSARRFDNQRIEAIIKCTVLNRLTTRGMPESARIQ
ncbi:MAG: transposase, partial [Acidobacteriota bacterium]